MIHLVAQSNNRRKSGRNRIVVQTTDMVKQKEFACCNTQSKGTLLSAYHKECPNICFGLISFFCHFDTVKDEKKTSLASENERN